MSPSLFPVITESLVMKDRLKRAVKACRPLRILPVIAGTSNRLELPALLHLIAEAKGITDGIEVVPERLDNIWDLESHINAILFLKGELISPRIQTLFTDEDAAGRFQHLDVVIAVLPLECFAPAVNGQTHRFKQLNWSREFQELCIAPLVWPSWAIRGEDHASLFRMMHERYEMKDGRMKPRLGESALTYLRAQKFKGTTDANKELRRGMWNHVRMEDSGDLQEKHFLPAPNVISMISRQSDRPTPHSLIPAS